MAKPKPSPRVAVFISDLHCGSPSGLLPPELVNLDDNPIGQNPFQRWLWKCWEDCWGWALDEIGRDPWALIVNGDIIEGNHHGTRELISPRDEDHGTAAYHALTPLVKAAAATYMVQGTECHTGEAEHKMATRWKTEGLAVRTPDSRRASWPSLRLEIAGCLNHIAHHINTTSRPYLEGSQPSIHLGVERVEAARTNSGVPRCVWRAHRHVFGSWRDAHGCLTVTPPWKGHDRYTRKVVPAASITVGLVMADWRHRDDGDIPDIRPKMHTAQAPKIERV